MFDDVWSRVSCAFYKNKNNTFPAPWLYDRDRRWNGVCVCDYLRDVTFMAGAPS